MASVHDGHRERMRNKYFRNGLDSFEPHEILEMLLFFTRRQGNTNPLAHKLINHFGSLNKVLTAPVEELLKIDGVGEHSAMLISMIIPLYRQCMMEQNPMPKIYNNVAVCAEYLQAYFKDKKNEEFVIMMFDNNLQLIGFEVLSEGVTNFAPLNNRKMIQTIILNDASNVLLAHNHPKGSSLPSKADGHSTIKIRDVLKDFGIQLLDHIVVGKDDYVSMISSEKYSNIFDDSKQKQALALLGIEE